MKEQYFAFISYKSEDSEWAVWLQHEIEHYHLPASYNGRTDIRQDLRPVFRDIDELSAGNLPTQIREALESSLNLIVICSPKAAKSTWVNQEIETFIKLGRTERIFPFIVDGKSPEEYFPPALLNLPGKEERLGGEVSKNGRDAAFIKVVAGMLGLGFDSLWNRYEKEKAEEERRIRKQRYDLLKLKSRFLSEKADELIKEGNSYKASKLMLEVLPSASDPEIPVTSEAERILRKARIQKTAIIEGHLNLVSSMNFSPDGKLIVSASFDNTIKIWETDKCKQILKSLTGHTDAVIHSSFSPDGKLIVSLSWDGTVRIWDVASGKQFGESIFIEKEVEEEIIPETLLPRKSIDLFPSFIDPWDFEQINNLQYETRIVRKRVRFNSVSFSPNSERIITTNDNEIRIWDVKTHKQIGEPLLGHTANVNYAVYDFSGEFILSASDDKTIRIWNSKKGQQIGLPFVGHKDSVFSAEFSPDGKQIVSTSQDQTVRRWDIETRSTIRIWSKILSRNASFIHEGKYIFVSGAISYYLIDTLKGKKHEYKAGSKSAISKDGLYVVSSEGENIIIDTTIFFNSGYKILKDNSCKRFNDAVYSPDGKSIITISSDNMIKIWDAKTLKLNTRFRSKNRRSSWLTLSADGKLLINSTGYSSFDVWDMGKRKILTSIQLEDLLYYVNFSFDGSKVMCITRSGFIKIFSVLSGEECCKPLRAFTDYPLFTHSFPQFRNCKVGSQFLSYAYDEEIKIWDALTFKQIGEPLLGNTANYSPDGKYLVCAKELTVNLLETSTRKLIRNYNLPSDYGWIENIFISPDNKYLMAVTEDTIAIWDFTTGVLVDEKNSKEFLSSVSFCPDGQNILSIDFSGQVRIWEFPTLSNLIAELHERYENNVLNEEERLQYYLD